MNTSWTSCLKYWLNMARYMKSGLTVHIRNGKVARLTTIRQIPNFFSFKGALGQLPYFFVGVASYRFATSLYNSPNFKRIMFVMVFLGIVLIQIVWFYPGEYASLSRLLYPVTLIPALFLLLASKWENRFFTWIGGYAYSIYLFHGFGTSGGRIILKMIGVNAILPIFMFASCIATAFPIILDKIVSRFKMLKRLLLGKL